MYKGAENTLNLIICQAVNEVNFKKTIKFWDASDNAMNFSYTVGERLMSYLEDTITACHRFLIQIDDFKFTLNSILIFFQIELNVNFLIRSDHGFELCT